MTQVEIAKPSLEFQNTSLFEPEEINDEGHHAMTWGAADSGNAQWNHDGPGNSLWPQRDPISMDVSHVYGIETIDGPFENHFRNPPFEGVQHQPYVAPRNTQNHGREIAQTAEMPTSWDLSPKICNELPFLATYSHYETSSARRLIRATTEDSYRLLMDPWSRPEDLRRLCTFVFCFMKVPRLLNLFRQIMDRTAKDNLEQWTAPQYHIGNAGFHYPRVGIDASSNRPPWWAHHQLTGPVPVAGHDTPLSESIVDFLEYPEIDGEWFDSNDAAEYLRSKGLNLDLHSDIVEISDAQELEIQASTASAGSYRGWHQMPETRSETWRPGSDTGLIDTPASSDQGFVQSLELPVLPESIFESRLMTKKYLDVNKFVKGTSYMVDT